MNYLLRYDEFILKEGLISTQIEKWKSKISTIYKNAIGIQKVLGGIIAIITLLGLGSMAILWGIFRIHVKYPHFVQECAKIHKAANENVNSVLEDEKVIYQIVDKFYNNKKLIELLKDSKSIKNSKNEIEKELSTTFTPEDIEILKKIRVK